MKRIQHTAALLSMAIIVPLASQAETFSMGLSVTDDISGKETGLRIYPGAQLALKICKKRQDKCDQGGTNDGANIDMGFGPWGLKVAAVRLTSNDSPEAIANFYRDDLARYGAVLDCSNTVSNSAQKNEFRISMKRAKNDDRPLREQAVTCEGENLSVSADLQSNQYEYKVGTEANQRIVSIKRDVSNRITEIALVHVAIRTPN